MKVGIKASIRKASVNKTSKAKKLAEPIDSDVFAEKMKLLKEKAAMKKIRNEGSMFPPINVAARKIIVDKNFVNL